MNCRQVERRLSDDLEGRLSRRQADGIAAHLSHCAACRRLRDDLVAAAAALRAPLQWPRAADVDRRALDLWLAERTGRARPPALARRWVPRALALGTAAAALLLVALGPATLRERSGPTSVGKQTARALTSRPDPASRSLVKRSPALTPRPPLPILGEREQASGVFLPSPRIGRGVGDEGGDRVLPGRLLPAPDDLASLNGNPVADARWWTPTRANDWDAIEASVLRNVRVGDDFVQIPLPRLADVDGRQMAAAVAQYRREVAVVDARLSREVTVAQKATALSDLCDLLRETTGIRLSAGSSVADEKVTLFCKGMSLRDVMRQLSRPFGYTWIRSGKAGDYRYELVQDLRSQLLEEELRNRDRAESLLALERDLERYRPYLGLTPDEALEQSKSATGPQKALLETLSGPGWVGIQMYFRNSSQELVAMRAGQEITYSGVPQTGQRQLPADVVRGLLQAFRDRRLAPQDGRYTYTPDATTPGAIAPAALPDASGRVHLRIQQPEVGRFALHAQVYFFTLVDGKPHYTGGAGRTCGSGLSTATVDPNNAKSNAAMATDPALRRPVTISLAAPSGGDRPTTVLTTANGREPRAAGVPKVATADVLEAIHRATGLPVVGDSYTRLYEPEKLSARNVSLFDALNRLADATRLRWRCEGEKTAGSAGSPRWLQFRTTNYYDERVKEVPNRLLSRWAEARRRQGVFSIEELVEIAGLADAQLDADGMAEGAREQWGLVEWDLARHAGTRPHLRFLAGFTPAQRQQAMGATGLLFSRMSLAQQQRYLALGLTGGPLESLDDLGGATLRVEYTQPGWFQWGTCGWSGHYTRWVIPFDFTPQGKRVPRPPVRERTREATLQAVRRVDPELRKALLAAVCRADPRLPQEPHVVEEDQIHPTQLDLAFVYMPGSTNARPLNEFHPGTDGWVWVAP